MFITNMAIGKGSVVGRPIFGVHEVSHLKPCRLYITKDKSVVLYINLFKTLQTLQQTFWCYLLITKN